MKLHAKNLRRVTSSCTVYQCKNVLLKWEHLWILLQHMHMILLKHLPRIRNGLFSKYISKRLKIISHVPVHVWIPTKVLIKLIDCQRQCIRRNGITKLTLIENSHSSTHSNGKTIQSPGLTIWSKGGLFLSADRARLLDCSNRLVCSESWFILGGYCWKLWSQSQKNYITDFYVLVWLIFCIAA